MKPLLFQDFTAHFYLSDVLELLISHFCLFSWYISWIGVFECVLILAIFFYKYLSFLYVSSYKLNYFQSMYTSRKLGFHFSGRLIIEWDNFSGLSFRYVHKRLRLFIVTMDFFRHWHNCCDKYTTQHINCHYLNYSILYNEFHSCWYLKNPDDLNVTVISCVRHPMSDWPISVHTFTEVIYHTLRT